MPPTQPTQPTQPNPNDLPPSSLNLVRDPTRPGRPLFTSKMDDDTRRRFDQDIIIGKLSRRELAAKYSCAEATVSKRRKQLKEAIHLATKHQGTELASEARRMLGWAEQAAVETYEIAKTRKKAVLTETGPVMITDPETGASTILEVPEPELDVMAKMVKEMRDHARFAGELDHEVGKIAELRAQAGIIAAAGGTPGVSQHQHLHVLVMPKKEGVPGAFAALPGDPTTPQALPAPPRALPGPSSPAGIVESLDEIDQLLDEEQEESDGHFWEPDPSDPEDGLDTPESTSDQS
jgi:hypothetical protein